MIQTLSLFWALWSSPHKGTLMRSFYINFAVSLNRLLNKESSCRKFVTMLMWGHSNAKDVEGYYTTLDSFNSIRPSAKAKWVIIGSDAGLSPNHYRYQCWPFANWTLGNKISVKFESNYNHFVYIMETILSPPQYIDVIVGTHFTS